MIWLPLSIDRELKAAALASYPEECCGLLVGQRRPDGAIRITGAVASANVTSSSPRRSFEVDPAVRLRLMRSLEGADEALIGHYHSHPDQPAVPSERDRASAFEPELLWLIIGVTRDREATITAWRFDGDSTRFRPLALALTD